MFITVSLVARTVPGTLYLLLNICQMIFLFQCLGGGGRLRVSWCMHGCFWPFSAQFTSFLHRQQQVRALFCDLRSPHGPEKKNSLHLHGHPMCPQLWPPCCLVPFAPFTFSLCHLLWEVCPDCRPTRAIRNPSHIGEDHGCDYSCSPCITIC